MKLQDAVLDQGQMTLDDLRQQDAVQKQLHTACSEQSLEQIRAILLTVSFGHASAGRKSHDAESVAQFFAGRKDSCEQFFADRDIAGGPAVLYVVCIRDMDSPLLIDPTLYITS